MRDEVDTLEKRVALNLNLVQKSFDIMMMIDGVIK